MAQQSAQPSAQPKCIPISWYTRNRHKVQSQPFLDDRLMDGPPNCSSADFWSPRLRKCPFDPDTIVWKHARKLGAGLDGFVWRVSFGDQGPFAFKLFWDTDVPSYGNYAAQQEAQNAALFQMIQTAVDKANRDEAPISVMAKPETEEDALDNLFAFCDEARLAGQPLGPDLTQIRHVPRLAKCYGWLKIGVDRFRDMPRGVRPHNVKVGKVDRCFPREGECVALVYEYIEDGENLPEAVEKVADFLWLVGFSHGFTPLAKNWRSGVLVDHSDIIRPAYCAWRKSGYGPRNASYILRE